jgi:hypothetical protein
MVIRRQLNRACLILSLCLVLGGCQSADHPSEAYLKEQEKKQLVKEKLLPKAEEYANLSYPVKEERDPTIKGRVVLVSNIYGESPRYEIKGYKQWSGADDPKVYSYGVSTSASTPEEVKTVVRVKCDKGKELGTVQNTKYTMLTESYYSSVCEVLVADMDARTIIARKTFENAKPVNTVVNLMKPDKVYMTEPSPDLTTFLRNMKRAP